MGGFKDFGGFYSNIGYIILGLAFIAFVKLRERMWSGAGSAGSGEVEFGTRLNFGVFLALGFALFAEGIFSAGYHICPNKRNFQFGKHSALKI